MNKRQKKKAGKKLINRESKRDALEWLSRLRRGTDLCEYVIGFVRENALKGKFSLADIGTSEEELEQLRIKRCRVAAKERLDRLRTGTNSRKDVSGIFVQALKGDLTLGDIDTSERELFMSFLGSD